LANAPQRPWAAAGGQGPWQARKPPAGVPESFQVDPHNRHMGVVSFYHKWRGYGFIDLTQKGVVPQDRVFVHWRAIQSDDRYPFLVQGLEVEFNLQKQRDWKNFGASTLRARMVSLVGGANIAMQDDFDAQSKTFIGGQHLRYTGTLKFFNVVRGFGYVLMDAGYDVDASVPQELRVDLEEVNAGGQKPISIENVAVEFGIWKNARGVHKVYNMTLPGGHPLTQDALENRVSMGSQMYTGEVAFYNWRKGFGFIRVDPTSAFNPRVSQKIAEMQELSAQRAAARGKVVNSQEKTLYFRKLDCQHGFEPQRGMQVAFQVYIDDKGAGAHEVAMM